MASPDDSRASTLYRLLGREASPPGDTALDTVVTRTIETVDADASLDLLAVAQGYAALADTNFTKQDFETIDNDCNAWLFSAAGLAPG